MKWGESEGGEGEGGGIENEKGEKEGRKLGMSRPEWTGGRGPHLCKLPEMKL